MQDDLYPGNSNQRTITTFTKINAPDDTKPIKAFPEEGGGMGHKVQADVLKLKGHFLLGGKMVSIPICPFSR